MEIFLVSRAYSNSTRQTGILNTGLQSEDRLNVAIKQLLTQQNSR